MNAFTLRPDNAPASASLFRGLGMQMDCYIYDQVTLDLPATGAVTRLRVSPERLPRQPDAPVHATSADETPLHDWAPLAAGNGRIDLDPGELTLISGGIDLRIRQDNGQMAWTSPVFAH